jgi:hypothetical protein
MLAVLIALATTPCQDPLPIDPGVVTHEMRLTTFSGADQSGPICFLKWEGGADPSLMVYGPTPMAELGREFTSAKQAAAQYAGESPTGVEPVPGVANAYMVFDPKVPNRRVFVDYKGKVYMIVSQDQVPPTVLAKAILTR